MTTTMNDEWLDATFSALANTTRRAILARLARGAATVNELAEPFDMTLPAVSKHLKVLEHAGLIQRGQHAQFRPCTIRGERLREVSTWADQYRTIWESRFDQLGDYLTQLHTPEGTKGTQ